MPRASSSGYSNAAAGVEVVYGLNTDQVEEDMEQLQGLVTAASAEHDIEEDREVASSAGTSSLTSGSKQDKSGPSTMTARQLPAPDAESPSDKGQQVKPTSSTATSTAGSTRVTGSVQQNQQASSAGSAAAKPATQGQGSDPKGGKNK